MHDEELHIQHTHKKEIDILDIVRASNVDQYFDENDRFLPEIVDDIFARPERIIDEIIEDDHFTETDLENLEFVLDLASTDISAELENVPTIELVQEPELLTPLTTYIDAAHVKDEEVSLCDENPFKVQALEVVANAYQKVTREWIRKGWIKASTIDRRVVVNYNFLYACWKTMDVRAVEQGDQMIKDLLVQYGQESSYHSYIMKLHTQASKDFEEVEKVHEANWTKQLAVKKIYKKIQKALHKKPPEDYPLASRLSWDGPFRNLLSDEYPHLLATESLTMLLSLMRHQQLMLLLNDHTLPIDYLQLEGDAETADIHRLFSPRSRSILYMMSIMQDSPSEGLWKFVSSHIPLQIGYPVSKGNLSAKVVGDPYRNQDYQKELSKGIRPAYHDVLKKIYETGDVTSEGYDNSLETQAGIYSSYFAPVANPNCFFEHPMILWERSRRLHDRASRIRMDGHASISVQGDRFTFREGQGQLLARNEHLKKMGITHLTIWSGSDKYPNTRGGYAAEIQVEGIRKPFLYYVDKELNLHQQIEGRLVEVVISPQPKTLLVDLVMRHVEAVKLGPRNEREKRNKGAPTIVEERTGIRSKHGPYASELREGHRRRKVRKNDLVRDAIQYAEQSPIFEQIKVKCAIEPEDQDAINKLIEEGKSREEAETQLLKRKTEDAYSEYLSNGKFLLREIHGLMTELIEDYGEDREEISGLKYRDIILELDLGDRYDSLILLLYLFPHIEFEGIIRKQAEARLISPDPGLEVTIKKGLNRAALQKERPKEVTYDNSKVTNI